ncbi:MAG: ABC transporter permease [Clostridiaceae bacterium]|nr:ABC transporter permease [Clostridiaceae bacterium]
MKKKLQNITDKSLPAIVILALIILLEFLVDLNIIPKSIMPSPSMVFWALVKNGAEIGEKILYTTQIGILGLFISFVIAFVFAILMDIFPRFEKAVYPLLVISQTIPTIAIAPLYVIWFGYGLTPKLLVIISVCFFPITINLLEGFKSTDKDMVNLVKSMGSSQIKTFFLVKLPSSLGSLFSGLKIAATYCIMGAVVAEWLGGDKGIGVFMIRSKRTYSYENMFAAIIVVIVLSILLNIVISFFEKLLTPWKE